MQIFIPADSCQIAQVIIWFIVSKWVKHKEQPDKQTINHMLIGKYTPMANTMPNS